MADPDPAVDVLDHQQPAGPADHVAGEAEEAASRGLGRTATAVGTDGGLVDAHRGRLPLTLLRVTLGKALEGLYADAAFAVYRDELGRILLDPQLRPGSDGVVRGDRGAED